MTPDAPQNTLSSPEGTSSTSLYQFPLCLPQRSANDVIREKLEVVVAMFNESTDPAERVELHLEVLRLRALLKGRP